MSVLEGLPFPPKSQRCISSQGVRFGGIVGAAHSQGIDFPVAVDARDLGAGVGEITWAEAKNKTGRCAR